MVKIGVELPKLSQKTAYPVVWTTVHWFDLYRRL